MKFIKISVLFIYIISNIFFSTGCWNYREVEQLGLAAGVAIDKDEDNNGYIVTAELINTEPSKGSTKVSPQLFSSRGKTIFDAVRNLILVTGKKIYWGHTKVIIINENIASNGIIPAIDWINRDSEPRQNTWILISRGITAHDVLKQKLLPTDVTSIKLNEIIKSQSPVYKFPQAEQLLKNRIEALLKKVQTSYKSDIFGFGDIIKKQHPSIWKNIPYNDEKVFSNLQFNVNVDLTIKGSGRISKPIKIGE